MPSVLQESLGFRQVFDGSYDKHGNSHTGVTYWLLDSTEAVFESLMEQNKAKDKEEEKVNQAESGSMKPPVPTSRTVSSRLFLQELLYRFDTSQSYSYQASVAPTTIPSSSSVAYSRFSPNPSFDRSQDLSQSGPSSARDLSSAPASLRNPETGARTSSPPQGLLTSTVSVISNPATGRIQPLSQDAAVSSPSPDAGTSNALNRTL
jgi:hypothetical protein